ncbi:MAG: DUF998 domain-containing protein [Promethearchaeota archaeon]
MRKIKFNAWGLMGSTLLLIAFIIPPFGFIGYNNEGYSLLNHAVSELGIPEISPLSWIFNACLIIGGFFILIFIIGFEEHVPGKFAKFLGMVSALSCSFVGVFPAIMSVPVMIIGHLISAMTFFFGGMLTVLVYTLKILRQGGKLIPRAISIAGFVVVGIFAIFLSQMFFGDSNLSGLEGPRPDYIPGLFFEWLSVLSIVGWMLLVATFFSIIKEP